MSIESKISTEEINIANLAVEAETRKFNPVHFFETEIVNKNKDYIYKDLERLEKEPDFPTLVGIARNLKVILDPAEFENIKNTYFARIGLENKLLELYENKAKDAEGYRLGFVAVLREIYPQTFYEKIGRDPIVENILKELGELYEGSWDWEQVFYLEAELKKLDYYDPGQPEFSYEEALKEIQNVVEQGRQKSWNPYASEDPNIYVLVILEELSNFRILYTKEFDETNVLSADDIKAILQNINKLYTKPRPDSVAMSSQLAAAKILLADKVDFGADGLHLTIHDSGSAELAEVKSNLPEIKKF